ncbi:MAG: metal-dependent transcriptional regulator [Deltaproteobacteria bacterium]|nr:metal-dependent transcriptional regulator [Deltaproteobacteria bacterium]
MGELAAEVSENYLKCIYQLSLDSSPVKTSRLAEALDLSPAAVTEMLKRLEEQKHVTYRPYRGVALTRRGRERALLVLRRHRLWEVFLYRVLGMPWPEVHEHAERLEHATDDLLANFLDEYLGRPSMDPHGHPIPGRDASIAEVERLRLTSLPAGSRASVVQCSNEDPALLAYLKGLGLVPGARLAVVAHAPFAGPLTLEVEGRSCVLGLEAARTLIVQRIDEAWQVEAPTGAAVGKVPSKSRSKGPARASRVPARKKRRARPR